ncbi:MAG: 5'-3' exonuclease H3TH domain-containing protein [Promethearchaeota archaeon]|jgi:flap endonuclease-1
MGIKINELVNDVKRTITFENLFKKEIAIDAFNTIYQFLAIIRQRDGTPLKDYQGNTTSHLSGLFYRSINFLEHNIKPIYVFDGKPSELKMDTIKERKKIKEEAHQKMVEAQDAEDFKEAKKFAQFTSKLDENMVEESKKLIESMGIPIVQASSEGEAQSTLDIEYVSLSKFLDTQGISREQLIEMGILIGTDFYPGIKGIGQKTALSLIKKYGSLENILKNKVQAGGKEIQLDYAIIEPIKNIFLNPDVKKEYKLPKSKKINFERIEELLVEQHNFSKQRVENALERLRKLDSKKTQVSLDDFLKKS